MEMKRMLRIVSALLVLSTLVLTACGGKETPTTPSADTPEATSNTDNDPGSETSDDSQPTEETVSDAAPAEPTATLSPQERFHELLVVHPEAFDFEVTEATHTYVYRVPLMVSDTLDYLLDELHALGWEELGKPTLMGHLATLNLQQEGYRLNISMQDNERSQATRIQMLLSEQ